MNSHLTSELAAQAVENRYDLVLIASRRVRELRNGHMPLVPRRVTDISTALAEIEAGLIGRDYLNNLYVHETKKFKRK
jgi:DNA-directed RNA polymerase omega subunit